MTMTTSRSELGAYLRERRAVIDAGLLRFLPRPDRWPAALYDALAWALFGGGKRLRPVLALAAFEAVGGPEVRPIAAVLPAACAVEMVHTYSLVHDDLPILDDDHERRGRPTVHVEFGEAMALLAGDALLTEAFRLAADRNAYQGAVPADEMLDVTSALARAAGWRGMVGGQSIDLGFEDPVEDEAALSFLHRRKTGELFRFSTWAGGLLGGGTPAQIRALSDYGETLGLAFQIRDDLLDDLQDQTERGGDAGATPSFSGLIGIEGSRDRAATLLARCQDLLASFDERADPLRHLAWFAVHRDH
jgi:geranylgeranyl diphosphate synthase type II